MNAEAPFEDRLDGGRRLAQRLTAYAERDDVVVLALPRGGVPVGFEVAGALGAPLDVFAVRKLGVPGQEELAFGAIASGGVQVLNDDIVSATGVTPAQIDAVAARERRELERRERLYRGDRPPAALEGRVVILVDDGLATGATMRAAVAALRRRGAGSIVVAVPTAAPETCAAFEELVDEVVCVHKPDPFGAVGVWYRDFGPTSDDEVRELLRRAAAAPTRASDGT